MRIQATERILSLHKYLYNFVVEPFSAVKTNPENDSSHSPVSEHSDPYSHWSKSPEVDEIYTKAKSECPHGDTGCDHGKFHIACCS